MSKYKYSIKNISGSTLGFPVSQGPVPSVRFKWLNKKNKRTKIMDALNYLI